MAVACLLSLVTLPNYTQVLRAQAICQQHDDTTHQVYEGADFLRDTIYHLTSDKPASPTLPSAWRTLKPIIHLLGRRCCQDISSIGTLWWTSSLWRPWYQCSLYCSCCPALYLQPCSRPTLWASLLTVPRQQSAYFSTKGCPWLGSPAVIEVKYGDRLKFSRVVRFALRIWPVNP